MAQENLKLANKNTDPVECLAESFPSDEARRQHYLKLLAQKLKDPEFRRIEGFPVGKDEDILALSDPPYYTACPNPWLGEFIKHHGTPFDPKQLYHREPFAADVSEGKNHPIYNAHSYHTKVPHRAIMRYILHYTEPGDLVFDGFCGTGMTGVAAQLCGDRTEVQALGYRVQDDGTILNEEGKPFSILGARRAILLDLSPAATLLSNALNFSMDHDMCLDAARAVIHDVKSTLPKLYETNHTGWSVRERKRVPHKQYARKTTERGEIEFTVYSDILSCPECAAQHSYYAIAVDEKEDCIKERCSCPSCKADLVEGDWKPVIETFFDPILDSTAKRNKIAPVLFNYSVGSTRFEKLPDDEDRRKLADGEKRVAKLGFQALRMIVGRKTQRNVPIGITHLHHFFTPLEHIFAGSPISGGPKGRWTSLRDLVC